MNRNVEECQSMLLILMKAAKESEDSTLLEGIKKTSFEFVLKKAYDLLRKVYKYEDNEQ